VRPKVSQLIVVLEGFLVWEVSYWFGGNYVAPTILQSFPSLPLITIATISSTILGLIVGIAYMAIRLKFVPPIEVTSTTIVAALVGILVTWFIASLSNAVVFGGGVLLFEEVGKISQPFYFYFTAFLVIGLGPLLEETVVRGYFFEILKGSWGDATGLLISSFLFVTAHAISGVFGAGLFFIGLDSIIFTFVYIKGGLIASGLTHVFLNSYWFYVSM